MLGGLLAGAGALGAGQIIANSNNRVANYISDLGNSVGMASGEKVYKGLKKISKSINHLNDTFYDEFNNRDKRLLNITFSDEDDEPMKLSEYFEKVPLFKESFRKAFYSETQREHNSSFRGDYREMVYENIEKLPNIKKALEIIKFQTSINLDFMPVRVYRDFFEDDVECENMTFHKGFNIINVRLTDDFIPRVKDIYRKEIDKINKFLPEYPRMTLKYDKSEFEWVVMNWNPSDETKKLYKRIDELVDINREEAQEMLMCYQEKNLRRSLKNFVKEGVTFKMDLDYEGKFTCVTLSKDNKEAYLIARLAPNVNVASKEGF